MKKIIKYLSIIIVFFILIHIFFIFYFGLKNNIFKSDLIVVFGNKIELNGNVSVRLKTRLDKAIELYEKGISKKILVSGGIGKEGFKEGDIMKKYLLSMGVKNDNIFVDNKGNNTYKTVLNTKKILEEKKLNSIIIISHYYHILRTKMAFEKAGFSNISYASADLNIEIRDPYSIFREMFGYYVYYFKNYN